MAITDLTEARTAADDELELVYLTQLQIIRRVVADSMDDPPTTNCLTAAPELRTLHEYGEWLNLIYLATWAPETHFDGIRPSVRSAMAQLGTSLSAITTIAHNVADYAIDLEDSYSAVVHLLEILDHLSSIMISRYGTD